MSSPLLRIENLETYFFLRRGIVRAVDGVSVSLNRGETLGLVGESGCGKSTVALSIMRLVPEPGKIVNGEIFFKDEDLLIKSDREMRKIRGADIAMIFQDPTSSLNPVFNIGDQIAEAIQLHQGLNKGESMKKVVELLEEVGIPYASERVSAYPYEFSGGMKQRAMIAMALSCNPSLLIADEPTTNLDATIQAQILGLMRYLKTKFNTSILLITHHLGIIAEMCDKVAVMYAGGIIEYADVTKLFYESKHPYTTELLRCIPRRHYRMGRLHSISGLVPELINPPSGCVFHPRCPRAMETCSKEKPAFIELGPDHSVACHLFA